MKVYMVTGGAGRVGLSISEALLLRGDAVVVTWHSKKENADSLSGRFPRRVGVVHADFSNPGEMDELFSSALSCFGVLDGIVDSASEFSSTTIDDMQVDDVLRMENIHATSPLMLSRSFYRWVQDEGRRGVVVHITDTRADFGYGRRVPYLLGKASLAVQTEILAKAAAPFLRVNAVAPGFVLPSGDGAYFEAMRSVLPLGKTGCPQDVVDAVLYLLGASYVTGETIHVDGGEHLL